MDTQDHAAAQPAKVVSAGRGEPQLALKKTSSANRNVKQKSRFWPPGWLSFQLILGGAFLLALGLLIVFAYSPYRGRLTVVGNIVARSVTLGLPNGLDDEPDLAFTATDAPPDRPVLLSYADTLEPAFGNPKATTPNTVAFTAKSIRLSALDLSPEARLTISIPHTQELELSAVGADAFYDLEVYEARRAVVDGVALVRPLPGSDSAGIHVKAFIDKNKTVPMRLHGKLTDRLTFDDVPISLVRFGEYRAAARNGRPIVSSIVSGTLSLPLLSHSQDIGAGSAIALEGFAGTLIRLEAGPDNVHIWFTGTVSGLKVGLAETTEDWFPSKLIWLYHIETITVALGLVAGAIALLGSFSNLSVWLSERKKPK